MSYCETLHEIVSNLGLSQDNWSDPEWTKLFPLISQDTLDDAKSKFGYFSSVFRFAFLVRPVKSIERVQKKMTEQSHDYKNYFKVVSDFLAFRIECDLSEMKMAIDTILSNLDKDDIVYVRGSTQEHRYGCIRDSKYVDIVQYIYVYIKSVGYIVEIQVGHPFATYTFTVDSYIRDHPRENVIDLWTDGFYDLVKQYLINQANGLNVISKDKVMLAAMKIHNDDIPEELMIILDMI